MTPKQNLLKALQHKQPRWVPCPMVDGSLKVIPHGLAEYVPEGGKDDWGVEWKTGEEKSGAGLPRTHPIENPEDVEKFPLPDVEKPDLMKPAIREMKNIDRSQTLVFGDNGWGIFERAWILVGMDKLLIWMYKEPDAVKNLMRRIAIIKERISERFINEVGVDGVRYGDDWGGDKALLMGPNLWRKFIKPYQKSLYRICKDKGTFVHQHSDGHIEEIISDLVEIGLDILNPLQPECNNLQMIKSEFGANLTFHGAIGSRNMDKGTPDQIAQEVSLRVKQLSSSGGYIIAPAHAMSYPKTNLEAFRKAAIKYGKVPRQWIVEHRVVKGDIEV